MSTANWEIFQNVKMYRSTSDPTNNMEHLFNLFDPVTGADPAANSLFNLNTLQKLVSLGQVVPNIINEPTLTYDTDFTLSEEWTELAKTLELSDTDGDVIGT